jgi:hypothetical protein
MHQSQCMKAPDQVGKNCAKFCRHVRPLFVEASDLSHPQPTDLTWLDDYRHVETAVALNLRQLATQMPSSFASTLRGYG